MGFNIFMTKNNFVAIVFLFSQRHSNFTKMKPNGLGKLLLSRAFLVSLTKAASRAETQNQQVSKLKKGIIFGVWG